MRTFIFDPEVSRILENGEATQERLQHLVQERVSLYTTMLWTPGQAVLLASIAARELNGDGHGQWVQLLGSQVIETDGEFTVSLGAFQNATALEIMIAAMALEADVSAVVAVTAQPPIPARVTQIIPKPPTTHETMARGTTWIRKGSYTV